MMDAVQGFFSAFPLEYVFLGAFALFIAIDTLRSGIGRGAALAVALPIAAFLFPLAKGAPFMRGMLSSDMIEAGVFLVLTVAVYLLVRRMGLEYVDGAGQPVQAAIAGVAVTAIGAVVWIYIPALRTLWEFSPYVKAIFDEPFGLFWILGAYAALAFARG